MTTITNGTIAFDPDELTWWTENYGTTDWTVYVAGMDEIVTHDKQGPGDDPAGDPLTFETARDFLVEFDRRFGPGSPMDRELPGDPGYAVALRNGVPSFGSHRHAYPTQPPHGSVFRPGDCACGYLWSEVAQHLEPQGTEAEWSVFVIGPMTNLVAEGQEIEGAESTGPAFTRDTAAAHAMALNEVFARIEADSPSPFNPLMVAVVLHHGVLETAAEASVVDTRHPGLITPGNAPCLADLDDDTSPYPAQITITCDGCPGLYTADYLVPAASTKAERFEIARDHLRGIGWSSSENGDFCPTCVKAAV